MKNEKSGKPEKQYSPDKKRENPDGKSSRPFVRSSGKKFQKSVRSGQGRGEPEKIRLNKFISIMKTFIQASSDARIHI